MMLILRFSNLNNKFRLRKARNCKKRHFNSWSQWSTALWPHLYTHAFCCHLLMTFPFCPHRFNLWANSRLEKRKFPENEITYRRKENARTVLLINRISLESGWNMILYPVAKCGGVSGGGGRSTWFITQCYRSPFGSNSNCNKSESNKKKGIILYSLYYYVCERAIVYCGLVILGNNVTRWRSSSASSSIRKSFPSFLPSSGLCLWWLYYCTYIHCIKVSSSSSRS